MTVDNHDPEWLRVELQRQDAYIDDNGFSKRVLHALPPRRNRKPVQAGIVVGAATAGCALTWALGGISLMTTALNDVARLASQGTISLVALGVVGCLVWGVVATAQAHTS